MKKLFLIEIVFIRRADDTCVLRKRRLPRGRAPPYESLKAHVVVVN